MSLIPGSFFGNGRRSNIFDPFSLDIWEPFQDLPWINNTRSETQRWRTRASTGRRRRRRMCSWRTSGTDEGGGEGGGGGREGAADPRREVEKEDKSGKWHRVERSSGKFLIKEVQAAGECQGGGGEGGDGEWGAYCHCAEAGGEEA